MSFTIDGATKIMFCCNEAVGLGHVRRTLAVGQYLRRHTPLVSQLILTGSPIVQSFSLPPGCDYIKLPSVAKRGRQDFEPLALSVPFQHVREMRRDMILDAARNFRPDVVLVDHLAAGIAGELVPTLRYLKTHAPETRLVLGLRDIVDEGSRVQREWNRTGIYELLENYYDLILVYGDPELYDVVAEYRIPQRTAAKLRYVGYLRREPGIRTAEHVRARLNMHTDRLVVVTAGGGADGGDLLRTMLQALRSRPQPIPFDCLLVAGPLMPDEDRAELRALVDERSGTQVLDFTPELTSYLGAADVVVAMSGYNTVCELLSLQRPAILVPRIAPSKEQLIRSEILSRRGAVRMIHPLALTARRLMDEVTDLLAHPTNAAPSVALDGLQSAANELTALLPVPRERDSTAYAPAATSPLRAATRSARSESL